MRLKLQIVRDKQVLFEVPLSLEDWPKEKLEDEFKAAEENFEKFSRMFDALSHETRLRMMRRLLWEENRTLSFAEFMRELSLNPKIVWENSRKLEESGFVKKTGRGKYMCSEFGQKAFLMMSLALHRLMMSLEQMEEF